MSDLKNYQDRLNAHLHGLPPTSPARNAAEMSADADAAAIRGQPTALPAANLGWLLRLWDRGPAGRGTFLLFAQVILIPLAGLRGLPGFFLGAASGVLFIVSLAMIAHGAVRWLARMPRSRL